MWRAAIALALLLVFASAVAASAGRSPRRAAISGTISIGTMSAEQPAWTAVLANFHSAYPNVTVNLTSYANVNVEQAALTVQLQAGNGPDLVEGGVGPSVAQFAQAGYVANLSSAPWVKRIPPWTKALVSYKKKVYGWLLRTTGIVINYNKGLFQSLGLKIPTTFAQYLKLCSTIRQKAPTVTPLDVLGSVPTALAAIALGFAGSDVYAEHPNWNAERAANKVAFQSSAGWKEALQSIVDLKTAGCLGPDAAAASVPEVIGQIASGQAAMLQLNDEGPVFIKAVNPATNIGFFAPPAATAKGTYYSVFPIDTLMIDQATKEMPAALSYYNFMAQQKEANLFLTSLGEEAPTAYQGALNPKIGAKALDAAHKFAAPFATTGRILVAGSTEWPNTTVSNSLGASVQGLITGQTTVQAALKAMDDAWPLPN